jgi:calcium-translocating P-type ATPase
VVPGDVMLLAPGDRVAADGRVIESRGLEVDEAMLTGESHPVPKSVEHGTDMSRIVLEGSDVVAGTGQAVVVAVGRQTRLGATAAALSLQETEQSPLGMRLGRLLRELLPLAAGGGAAVVASGFLRGRPLLHSLAVGSSIALASVPEGLPLLAGMGEAAVARRLADENALVRRLSSVEALGRVDVCCTDKTGTLTAGKLAVRIVASNVREAKLPSSHLTDALRRVLLTAALASPHPDAADARAHPTDVAVITAAESAGDADKLRAERGASAPFDPARGFHAVIVDGRMCVKGAPEVVVRLCAKAIFHGSAETLDDHGRETLLARAEDMATRGLRVLMVAEGPADTPCEHPRGLVAMGFLGISDPLRDNVPAAVAKCREAGVRIIMLTGDHPATARAIAHEAGLPAENGSLLVGNDISELDEDELDERLEHATVIARATPLDKLRIIESLRRRGHTIAMTGDGVNDAPALRLADVGVAMGHAGTEVARQAADVVLTDDDFSTLVQALLEGRSFWRNMRRALALLLGGNLGELGLVVGATVMGAASPLTTRQILAVNLITDALPALSVVLQKPEHRNLSELRREGTTALDVHLRRDVMRRGLSTTVPALAAFLYTVSTTGNVAAARSVAFGSVVATQLAQTLEAGRAEGGLTRPVLGAVGASGLVLAAAFAMPPLASIFTLSMPASGWAITGATAVAAVAMSKTLKALSSQVPVKALPAPRQQKALPGRRSATGPHPRR